MSEPKILDIIRKDAEYFLKEIQETKNSEAEAIRKNAERASEKLLKDAQLRIQGEADHLLDLGLHVLGLGARRHDEATSCELLEQ